MIEKDRPSSAFGGSKVALKLAAGLGSRWPLPLWSISKAGSGAAWPSKSGECHPPGARWGAQPRRPLHRPGRRGQPGRPTPGMSLPPALCPPAQTLTFDGVFPRAAFGILPYIRSSPDRLLSRLPLRYGRGLGRGWEAADLVEFLFTPTGRLRLFTGRTLVSRAPRSMDDAGGLAETSTIGYFHWLRVVLRPADASTTHRTGIVILLNSFKRGRR